MALTVKRRRRYAGRVFWMGVMVALSMYGLVQDFLGKEMYLHLVSTQWINLPWFLWLVPIAVGYIMYVAHAEVLARCSDVCPETVGREP
jgi:hypothetical protein